MVSARRIVISSLMQRLAAGLAPVVPGGGTGHRGQWSSREGMAGRGFHGKAPRARKRAKRKNLQRGYSMNRLNLCMILTGIAVALAASSTSHAEEPMKSSAPAPEQVFRAGACAIDVSPAQLPVLINGGFLQ